MMKAFRLLFLTFVLLNNPICDAEENTQKDNFRDYTNAPAHVKAFYTAQHTHQTYDFANKKLAQYRQLNHGTYSIWEVLELLSKVVDESDPDLDLPQIQHALQTAEAMRKDGHPDWFILVGLIHDLGKMLAIYGEPQWAIVGDTFPVGCQFSDKIVLFDSFKNNPDQKNPLYNSKLGVYSKYPNQIGLKNVTMSWGHDEYLYQIINEQSVLPEEAKFVVRYHSFYPLHKEGAYQYLLDENDKKMLPWLKKFQQYDLYSKSSEELNVAQLKPYYINLINKYFPNEKLNW